MKERKAYKIIFLIISLLLCNYSHSQVTITSFDKKEKVEEEITPQPLYDSLEKFKSFYDYYYELDHQNYLSGLSKPKRCSKEIYYKRYVGLQVYYPPYSDKFDNEYIYIMKQPFDKLLKWSDVGNRYYTIMNIFDDYKSLPPENKKDLEIVPEKKRSYSQIFVLKDNTSGDIIYSIGSDRYLILVPYLEKLKQIYDGKEVVATGDFSANTIPLTGQFVSIISGSIWKCKVSLIREDEIIDHGGEELIIVYILNNENKNIIALTKPDYGCPVMEYSFILKNDYIKLEKQSKQEKQSKANNYIKKFGKVYGPLVEQGKVKIGMTKKMCEESWGNNHNSYKTTNSSGEKDVWNYSNSRSLVFANGILEKIIQ